MKKKQFHIPLVVLQFVVGFFLIYPLLSNSSQVHALSFGNVSDTLSNSRFSFKGALNANTSAAAQFFTLGTSTSYPDRETGNLFNGDSVCFNGANGSGCEAGSTNSKTYTVNSITTPTGVTFGTSTATTNALNAGDYVVSSQSAVHTISFKPTTTLTTGNKITVKIPANSTSPTDGIPDADGFDSRASAVGFPQGALSVISGGAGQYSVSGFTVSAATLATAAGFHVFTFTLSSTITSGSTYTIVIGNSATTNYQLINPAPAGTSHTRGVADPYSIRVFTCDSGCTTTYDDTTVKVDPVDGVLVSATVEQTLTFTIAGNNSTTKCGVTTGNRISTSGATSIPFGSITSSSQFYGADQTLTVVTNSPSGYAVSEREDGPLTSGSNTIPNTGCNSGTCSAGAPSEWTTLPITTNDQGLGFSLDGTDPAFTTYLYNDGGATFKAQPFDTTARTIMSKATPTSSSVMDVCYRLGVLGTQTAGFYYNKITYVATPLF